MENEELENLPPSFALGPRSDRPRKNGPPNLPQHARAVFVFFRGRSFRARHPAEYSKPVFKETLDLEPPVVTISESVMVNPR
jgi:hypothetical protein